MQEREFNQGMPTAVHVVFRFGADQQSRAGLESGLSTPLNLL